MKKNEENIFLEDIENNSPLSIEMSTFEISFPFMLNIIPVYPFSPIPASTKITFPSLGSAMSSSFA